MPWPTLRLPLALAALVTLTNAAKPVTVDDTAYLLHARHIRERPADPYGFTLFWWDKPDDAMEVLSPPVIPYWLALGISIFGENIFLLKLWIFPFVSMLAISMLFLLQHFARGVGRNVLLLLMLSPAVVPSVNLMLDIPAAAIALTSVVLFIRSAHRKSGSLAVLAGLVAGLATQTKYSAFVAPAVILWLGLAHGRLRCAVLAAGVCAAVFIGWELFLVQKYGRS
ncbi:MAG: glycosyltransferase family 39 protein, partial [Gemmataceae bacterium]|nr:glycosyltransferase family 39 protein [Gemmataceae bacterium]